MMKLSVISFGIHSGINFYVAILIPAFFNLSSKYDI